MTQLTWRTLSGRRVEKPVSQEIIRLTKEARESGDDIRICIGTDSQVKGSDIHFATVIVLLRVGSGAVVLARKQQVRAKLSIKQRMLEEVNRSMEVAIPLQPLLNELNIRFEIHADINTHPSFKSHDAFSEAIGYIQGMGFDFRAKPFAFASSSCANRLVQ